MSYEHGARRFKYLNLSSELQELCQYDAEFSEKAIQLAEQRKSELRAEYSESIAKREELAPPTVTNNTPKLRSSSPAPKSKPKAVKARGSLTVKLARTKSTDYHYTYRNGRRYRSHYKTLTVKALSSVPAKIYDGDRYVRSITPMETIEFSYKTNSDGKYWLELRTKSGKVLGKQAWNRKIGL